MAQTGTAIDPDAARAELDRMAGYMMRAGKYGNAACIKRLIAGRGSAGDRDWARVNIAMIGDTARRARQPGKRAAAEAVVAALEWALAD